MGHRHYPVIVFLMTSHQFQASNLPKVTMYISTRIFMHVHAFTKNIKKANATRKLFAFVVLIFKYALNTP